MSLPYPLAPKNVFVYPGEVAGSLIIQWDSPRFRLENTNRVVIGCHVYRSNGSPDKGFEKITQTPIETLSFIDGLNVQKYVEEPARVIVREECDPEPTLVTKHRPIAPTEISYSYHPTVHDVKVIIDGEEKKVARIVHESGEIILDNKSRYDPITRQMTSVVDFSSNPDIQIEYSVLYSLLPLLSRVPIYYKVTSVDSNGLETPLDACEASTYLNTDSIAWYWKEAIWRNSWLLYQGGERVKHFARKWAGVPCTYRTDPDVEEVLQSHPHNCPVCFGTGIVGGFAGPHDILIAPPDSEHNFEKTNRGYVDNFNQATWTGPSPIITQRDLIIKQSGERFLVGPVSAITCPGAILQQEFTLQPIDLGDYLYRFPIEGTSGEPGIDWPTITDKPGAGPEQERGRTEVFVETTHGAEGAVPKEFLRRKK